MDDDVLVALGADQIDRLLDLTDRCVAGVELQAHSGARAAPDEAVKIHVGGGDLDRVAADAGDEIQFVLERDRGEEGETQRVAECLELAPFVRGQRAPAQDVVQRLAHRLHPAGLAIHQHVVTEKLLAIGNQTVWIDDLEFYRIGLGCGGMADQPLGRFQVRCGSAPPQR